jgi:hypothetical protein
MAVFEAQQAAMYIGVLEKECMHGAYVQSVLPVPQQQRVYRVLWRLAQPV